MAKRDGDLTYEQRLRLRIEIAELLAQLAPSRLHLWPPAMTSRVRLLPGWPDRPQA